MMTVYFSKVDMIRDVMEYLLMAVYFSKTYLMGDMLVLLLVHFSCAFGVASAPAQCSKETYSKIIRGSSEIMLVHPDRLE